MKAVQSHFDQHVRQASLDALADRFDRLLPEEGPLVWPMNSNRLGSREISAPEPNNKTGETKNEKA